MPAGNAICGSHDRLGLRGCGHGSAVSTVCGDEDQNGEHVKSWRLALCLFRMLMTSYILGLCLANCRNAFLQCCIAFFPMLHNNTISMVERMLRPGSPAVLQQLIIGRERRRISPRERLIRRGDQCR